MDSYRIRFLVQVARSKYLLTKSESYIFALKEAGPYGAGLLFCFRTGTAAFLGTAFAVTIGGREDKIMKKADNHDQTREIHHGARWAPPNGSAKAYYDRPIPKPSTELGFQGITHKRSYDSISRRRRRDN